ITDPQMELTVKLVSGECSQSFDVAPSRMRLSINTELRVRLENDSTPLSSYNLSSGSTVMLLVAPIQVSVKNVDGKSKTYDVTEEETVDELQRKVHNKEGTAIDQQKLIYNGRQLEAGRKLKEYGIENGSNIQMSLLLHQRPQDAARRTLPTGRCPQDAAHRTLPSGRCCLDSFGWWTILSPAMELTVKLVSGEGRTVRVSANATVGDLKQAAAKSFDVAASRVRLSTGNGLQVRLENDFTPLSSCGLSWGSTVMLLLLVPFQVFVKNEEGVTKTYDVTEEETVDELQKKVYNKERTPVNQMRLIYNGRQLEVGKKLREYDITNGSTIHMTLRLRGG
ncbi:hypothetical protein NFI96_025618, partial [Prochilodus magdalenae]